MVGIKNTMIGADKIVKSELIHETWETALNKEHKKTDVESVVNAFVKTLGSEIKKGNTVKVDGLGTFSPHIKQSYIGRNISTGTIGKIPQTTYVRFVPSSKIKP